MQVDDLYKSLYTGIYDKRCLVRKLDMGFNINQADLLKKFMLSASNFTNVFTINV